MRRIGTVAGLACIALTSGCVNPLRVSTFSKVGIDGTIFTSNRVTAEIAPTSEGGPIQSVTVAAESGNSKCAKIALIDLDGLLLNDDLVGPYSMGENPVGLFREKLDALRRDPAVKAVVLRINSPGGSATASDIMRRDLKAYRDQTGVPVVACLMDVGAGGAYYLAASTDSIVAHPTCVVGGIGVIINLYNLKDVLGFFNVSTQEVKAGANINLGAPNTTISPEAKKQMQAIADELHDRFIQAVRQGRPNIVTAEANTFDGRVFAPSEALRRGLIDQTGYLDDAILLAGRLAKVEGAPVAMYRRANDSARSVYAITPNVPLQGKLSIMSVPGLDRTRLPAFLYLWQPESTLEKLGGK